MAIFDKDVIISHSMDKMLKFWNLNTKKCIKLVPMALKDPTYNVCVKVFDYEGEKHIACVASDFTR